MTNAIVSTLRKREVESGPERQDDAGRRTHSKIPPPNPSRKASATSVRCCATTRFARRWISASADDEELKEYVVAIETFEDTVPAARDIASLLGVPETEIYNRRRKLARRLGKHGFTASRRRSKV